MKENFSVLLPGKINASEGEERRVGVELELAGLDGNDLAECIVRAFGGTVRELNRCEYLVTNTRFGKFKVELDSSLLKASAQDDEDDSSSTSGELINEIKTATGQLVTRAAQELVPWEIVAPPIPISQLGVFHAFFKDLRLSGAKGTRQAIRYAFGVHLNPELPATDSATILSYLRAYCCLYPWLAAQEKVDLSRRLTPYIKHFSDNYIDQILSQNYQPTISTLIDDYLIANPTRNRGLDLLPLFAHIDESRVRHALGDERIQARPTLHYRLPNCEIDNPEWSLAIIWWRWLHVEFLVDNQSMLNDLSADFIAQTQTTIADRLLSDTWQQRIELWIKQNVPIAPLNIS